MAFSEEAGRFFEAIGARAVLVENDNRLDLFGVDWTMVEEWAAEGRRRTPDVRLELITGSLPLALVEVYIEAQNRLLKDVPREAADLGDWTLDAGSYSARQARLAAVAGIEYLILARARPGEVVGLTELEWSPGRATVAYQQLTAVEPGSRGRGLGRRLKAGMLLGLRASRPEVRWVLTDNAGSNAPMLAINHRLGFRTHRRNIVYQVDRESLAGFSARRRGSA